MMDDMDPGMSEEEKRAAIRAELAAEREKCETHYEEYKAHKTERDAAAFAVIDESGDRTLSEEFLDRFMSRMNKGSRDESRAVTVEPGNGALKKEAFLTFLEEGYCFSDRNHRFRSALGLDFSSTLM